MNESEAGKHAFAMLLTSAPYPPGPYPFAIRESLILRDLTLSPGTVVHYYLAMSKESK